MHHKTCNKRRFCEMKIKNKALRIHILVALLRTKLLKDKNIYCIRYLVFRTDDKIFSKVQINNCFMV